MLLVKCNTDLRLSEALNAVEMCLEQFHVGNDMASRLSGPMIIYFMCAGFSSYSCSLYRVGEDFKRPGVLLSVSCGLCLFWCFFCFLFFFNMEA